jgi:hypothetical protein
MATFKVSNPEQFDFSKPEGWQKYIQRFERFRRASGLIDKDGTLSSDNWKEENISSASLPYNISKYSLE